MGKRKRRETYGARAFAVRASAAAARRFRDAADEGPYEGLHDGDFGGEPGGSGLTRTPGGGGGGGPQQNRVRAILAHCHRYAFESTERLARDVGVSPRTIRRLLSGETAAPSLALAEAVTGALRRDLRLPVPLPLREVFSPDGTYPTPSTCELCLCDGCLPERAYDRHGRRKPEWQNARPGDWCRYPRASARARRRAEP